MDSVVFNLLSICLVAIITTYFNSEIFDSPSFTNNILPMAEVDAKFNYRKDYGQITIDKAFDSLNLDNISDAAPFWLATRTAIVKRLTETDGMYEYLVDYAKHDDVHEEDRIELMVRNEYE